MARVTLEQLADQIAGTFDGEYDDGLEAHLAASHVGGSSTERMVDLDVADADNPGHAPQRFVILIREVE